MLPSVHQQEIPENNSFSKSERTMQVAWDSTSISALKECPRKYQLSIMLGYTPAVEAVDLAFGQVYHSAIELYHRERARGESYWEAQKTAIHHALLQTWDYKTGRPVEWVHPTKSRFTLIRTLVWYFDQFEHDPIQTLILANGQPAVEVSFTLKLDYTCGLTGEPYMLCGRFDRMGVYGDEVVICDYKTTRQTLGDEYFSQWTPNNQMSAYIFAGQVIYPSTIQKVIIDGARVLVTGSEFRRGIVVRTQNQIAEWYADLGFWLHQAEYFAKTNYWPMNDKSCYRCQFKSICASDPAVREEWLQAKYQRRIWDPMKRRDP